MLLVLRAPFSRTTLRTIASSSSPRCRTFSTTKVVLDKKAKDLNELGHVKTPHLFSMKDKIAVITGGAGSLGSEFARAFLESGCASIAILDLEQAKVDAVAKALKKSTHGKADVKGFVCDVTKESEVKSAFKGVMEDFGQIDTLVTAAGIAATTPTLDYSVTAMRHLFDVNVHGTMFCAREAAKHMIAQKTQGTMVLIGSVAANIVPQPQPQAPYNAAKAAVKHLTASLAVEWAPLGIRVNCLSPGYIMTPLLEGIFAEDKGLQDKWVGMTPQRRIGEPRDLKGAVVFLASDASKFTTGAEVRVDGGYTSI